MRNVGLTMLSAADTGSATGAAVDANQLINASFIAVTGDTSAGGTVQIQCSNDVPNGPYRELFVPTNWANVPNATITVTSGVAATALPLQNMAYGYLRAVYTRSSGGSSTIQVLMNATGV